jgi:phosphate transport system substrate-binding protein
MRLDKEFKIFRLISLGLLVIALVFMMASCSQPIVSLTPTQPATILSVGYVDSVSPLVDVVAPVFGDEEPSVYFDTSIGNIETLTESLSSSSLEAIILPGDPNLYAQQYISSENESTQWMSVIALDGLSIIVNKDNPINGLTLSQVQAIFRGQAWSWEMVGGANANIEVVTSDSETAISVLFRNMVMGLNPETLTAVMAVDSNSTIEYVSQHSWAIGYVAASVADDRVKQLAIEGLYPEPDTFLTKEYPLSYPIYLISMNEPQGDLRKFATWLLSPDGQAVLGRLYGRVR